MYVCIMYVCIHACVHGNFWLKTTLANYWRNRILIQAIYIK